MNKKKGYAVSVLAALVLATVFCGCGEKNEGNSAFDEAKAEVKNAENEDVTDVSYSSTSPGDTEAIDSSSAEESAPVYVEPREEDGYFFVYWNDDCLSELKDGEKELWLRLYKNENREEGYEISTSDTHWTFTKLGMDGVLFDANSIEKNGTEWTWVNIYSDFWADMADCTYYEAIMNDVKNSDNRGLVADGKIEQKVPESETTLNGNADGANDSAPATADYWYIDNVFKDAVGHEFVFFEPDSDGFPKKITISNWPDEYDGTYDFEFTEGMMSPAKYDSEPWIVGTVKGIKGSPFIKDLLADDNGRTLGIDIRGE
ncbi:MAG: hypothetical protein K5868_10075 [Lachnospiraceae bacterium]|nr:hypothetical protein [Lachnospiraceae bacterium]